MPLPLHIFEERYRLMFDRCINEEQPFGVLLQTGKSIQNTGCLAQVENVINRYDDGRLDVLTVGTERFLVRHLYHDKPYLEADIEIFHDSPAPENGEDQLKTLAHSAMEGLKEFARVSGYTMDVDVLRRLDYEELSFLIATTDVFSVGEKQELLELRCTATRIQRASRALNETRERRAMESRIRKVLGKPEDEDITNFFN